MLVLRILCIGLAWSLAFGHDGSGGGGQLKFESYGWGMQNVDKYLTVGWNPAYSIENLQSNTVQFVQNRDTVVMPGAKEGFEILHLPTKCGAELWGGAKNQEFFGNDPHYSGPARMRVRLHEKIEEEFNDGGFICDDIDTDNNTRTDNTRSYTRSGYLRNLQFFCPTFQLCGTEVAVPRTMTVQICAFARECRVFDSIDDYARWNKEQKEEGVSTFADKSFAMESVFRGEHEQHKYCAIFSGRVVRAERKVNDRTGEPFFWALVETLGDHQIDMVVHPLVVRGNPPRPGSIILGLFFLSGRLLPEDGNDQL